MVKGREILTCKSANVVGGGSTLLPPLLLAVVSVVVLPPLPPTPPPAGKDDWQVAGVGREVAALPKADDGDDGS